jgi:ribosome-binding protein aMBF1 (putative translation factor)
MNRASPIGTTVAQDRARRSGNPRYRAEQARVAAFEQLARVVIKWRSARNLSQEALAKLVGTSNTAISRIESGQHQPNVETLRRIARAMDLELVIEFAPKARAASVQSQ